MHKLTSMWLPRSVLIVCALTAMLVALLVALLTVWLVNQQVNEQMRAAAINACDGNNTLRGFALLATRVPPINEKRHSLANQLLRVRDCEATFDSQKVVTIAPEYEERFLEDLAKGRPIVVREGGRRIVPKP